MVGSNGIVLMVGYNAKLEIADSYLASESNPRVRYAIQCGIAKLQCKYGIALANGASICS